MYAHSLQTHTPQLHTPYTRCGLCFMTMQVFEQSKVPQDEHTAPSIHSYCRGRVHSHARSHTCYVITLGANQHTKHVAPCIHSYCRGRVTHMHAHTCTHTTATVDVHRHSTHSYDRGTSLSHTHTHTCMHAHAHAHVTREGKVCEHYSHRVCGFSTYVT
jgi:hypothetical protein